MWLVYGISLQDQISGNELRERMIEDVPVKVTSMTSTPLIKFLSPHLDDKLCDFLIDCNK